MSSNEQRKDFGFSSGSLSGEDEVEGHVLRGRGITDDDDTAAEGHGLRRGAPDEGDEAEGHGIRSGRMTDDEGDDTEGHGVRIKI